MLLWTLSSERGWPDPSLLGQCKFLASNTNNPTWIRIYDSRIDRNFFPLPFPSPPLLPFPCAIFPFWFSRLSHGGVGGVEGVVNFHNNIFQRQKKNNIF